MADNIQSYISSGILEAYVVGSLSENEEHEVLEMKKKYPSVNQALNQIEHDIESLAMHMAVPPPPALWNRIESELNGLIETKEPQTIAFKQYNGGKGRTNSNGEQQFIEVEAQSEYIKVHRWWRPAFIAVFILSKIFLATAIYFYIENRHNQQEVNELKARVNQLEQVKH